MRRAVAYRTGGQGPRPPVRARRITYDERGDGRAERKRRKEVDRGRRPTYPNALLNARHTHAGVNKPPLSSNNPRSPSIRGLSERRLTYIRTYVCACTYTHIAHRTGSHAFTVGTHGGGRDGAQGRGLKLCGNTEKRTC